MSEPLLPKTWPELRATLAAIGGCEAVGIASAASGAGGIRDWLPTLDKPRWQPPDQLFGPVWTLLYATMGVSLRAVRRTDADPRDRERAQRLFAVQLAANALWSFLFFNRRSPRAAALDGLLIVVAVTATIKAIWRVHRGAALLLLPYLAWSTFALALATDIARRNPPA